jgi:hypothetical protein
MQRADRKDGVPKASQRAGYSDDHYGSEPKPDGDPFVELSKKHRQDKDQEYIGRSAVRE